MTLRNCSAHERTHFYGRGGTDGGVHHVSFTSKRPANTSFNSCFMNKSWPKVSRCRLDPQDFLDYEFPQPSQVIALKLCQSDL